MCGIAGIANSRHEVPPHAVLERMGEVIAYRGPDDCGYYAGAGIGMVHRRLSIIDLSANARQPMSTPDGNVWVAYNGEIYNYRELRDTLADTGYEFHTASDTEVLLQAYVEHGMDCVRHFNGMFAFALWDAPRKRLFAARDRIGIKPFYYWFDGKTLVFGSEIKALLQHPAISVEPDWEVVRQYLLFNHALGDSTWYKGIRQLPPGYYLLFEGGNLTIGRYWELKLEADCDRNFASFRDELQELLQDAVRLHLRSDVPVGAYLSGGIDSSSVVALASAELPNGMHTFSVAFAEGEAYDERPYIDVIAQRFHTQHHEVVPEGKELAGLLPTLLWHLDEPVVGPAVFPMYRLCELVARSGVVVVNGGQGGDELFGGYSPYYAAAVRNLWHQARTLSPMPVSEVARIPGYLVKGGAAARLWTRICGANRGCTGQWLRTDKTIRSAAMDAWQAATPVGLRPGSFEQLAYMDLSFWLPGLLQQEDRISMAWSIESRVPLLDYRLVEFAGRIPSWMKVRRGVLKAVLRAAMRGRVPDRVLDRKDKKGLPTPISVWFRRELAGYLRRQVLKPQLLCAEVVEPAVVGQLIEDHQAETADHGALLWKILNTEIWLAQVAAGWPDRISHHEFRHRGSAPQFAATR